MRWNRQRHDDSPFGQQRVAFVLSGGGSLGAMQAGQLLAMFEAGITPDLVIGVSAGALNGAAIAYDPTIAAAEQLATIWRGMRREYIFRGSRVERAWHVVRRHPNLYRSDGLVDLVNRFLPVNDLSTNCRLRSKHAPSTSTMPESTSTPPEIPARYSSPPPRCPASFGQS